MRDDTALAIEILVPFETTHGRHPEATHVRSTLIVSSMQALRARGLLDAYVSHLDPVHRDDLLSLIAGTWIPIGIGLAHYRAAQQLDLDSAMIEAIGAEVGERINKSVLSVVVKMSKQAGVTPWTALGRAHRLRELTWKGSDLAVMKLGPKEARLDWTGIPYAGIPYYVTSFGGFLRALVQLFCSKAYTRFVPEHSSAVAVSYRISWA
jgi:hypothetical protein